jgi:hypothetical protein
MPRVPLVCTCVFCPHLLNLARSVSCVLHAAHYYLVSVCSAPLSLVSRCAGVFSSTPGDRGTASDSSENPGRIKPPNTFETVTLFLTLLASVLSIIVSVLKLLEMTSQR